MSVKDKSTREVELNGFNHVNTVDWTANSKSVYVTAISANGTDAVVEVEPSGNQRQEYALLVGYSVPGWTPRAPRAANRREQRLDD